MDTLTAYNLFYNIRSRAKIDDKCAERINSADPNERYECFDDYCLFDLHQDPCEYRNVGKQNERVLNMTLDMLVQFKKELVLGNRPRVDPNADPKKFNGYWDTWLEHGGSNALEGPMYLVILVFCAYLLTV